MPIATRSPKQDRLLEELEAGWRRRAEQVGLTPAWVASITGRHWEVTPADPQTLSENLASPDGLAAKASTFAEAEAVKAIAAALPEGRSRDDIEALTEAFLHTREVVPLLPEPAP